MTHRNACLTALLVLLGLAGGGHSIHATSANRLTYLTFNQPVALPGVTLAAGTYAFELADPTSNATVVSVSNKTRTRAYFMSFTRRIDRPRGMADSSSVSFGEAPRGQARPIVAWYPPDSSDGLKFIYR